MLTAPLSPIVFMVLLVAGLAYLLFRGPSSPRADGAKSALARDGGQGGNWYLLSKSERAALLEQRKGNAKS